MNKTVLVTGASRGIGRAIAYRFAREGYSLIINCSKSADALMTFKSELEQNFGVSVLASIGNIGDYSYAEKLFQEIKEEFGGVDIVINNAGISHIGLLSDMSAEDWHRIIDVNLSSVFYTSKLAIPYMVSNKRGKIINISSVWGNIGSSCEVAYSASKGGINSFTKALAKELAPSNIQVNAIACGCIDTEMNRCFSKEERRTLIDEIPAGRFGTPEEVADLAYSLATGHEYLTGQIISFDGGWC